VSCPYHDQWLAIIDVGARHLFLGRSCDKLGKPDDAEKAYRDATRIKPTDVQAWLGLQGLFESKRKDKVDEYVDICLRLAELYADM
jgi:superkiller protein 3